MKFFKFISVFFGLLLYLFVGLSITLLVPAGPEQRRTLIRWMHRFSQTLLQLLDIHYWMDFRSKSDPGPGTLFLANHVSYLDVLILASRYPSVFVTSVEVQRSPFLGWLAKLSGSYFVERRNKTTLKKDIAEIRAILEMGMNVVLFPEGTTSDGSRLLPFKASLLEAIVNTDIEVRPLCLNYRFCNGEAVSLLHRELLFYYGEMNLWKQLGHLLEVSEVLVELIVLPPLAGHDKSSRSRAAQTTQRFISEVFAPIVAGG